MVKSLKRFFKEEDGIGTVEIVIIIAILVGLAVIFRKQIYSFINQIFDRIFDNAGNTTDVPNPNENPDRKIGE